VDQSNLLAGELDMYARVLTLAKTANENADKLFQHCTISNLPAASDPAFPLVFEMAKKCQQNINGLHQLNLLVLSKGKFAKSAAIDLRERLGKGTRYHKSVSKLIAQIDQTLSANRSYDENLKAIDKVVTALELEQINRSLRIPKEVLVSRQCESLQLQALQLSQSVYGRMKSLSWYYKAVPFMAGWGRDYNFLKESTQSAIQEMEHQTQKSECKFLRPANNRSIELSIERARNVIGIEEKNNE
jgi:hypothetical protein